MNCTRYENIAFVINKNSGDALKQHHDIRQQDAPDVLKTVCPHGTIFFADPDDLEHSIAAVTASRPDVIVVAGGDGTLNTAANQLADTDIALGILPAGTFNLVAKDLSIPLRVEKALHTIMQGTPRRIDAGEMNGRIFLHHVSIGIHSRAVELREAYLKKTGLSKMLLTVFSLLRAILVPPISGITLDTGQHEMRIRAPFLFIGSNRFETSPFTFLRRKSFNENCLNVFFTRRHTPQSLLKMALQTLFEKNLENVSHLETLCTEQLTITGNRPEIKVIMDGEVVRTQTPLRCRVRPHALRVIGPQI